MNDDIIPDATPEKHEASGIKTRIFEITGDTDDIEQALDQWQQERQTNVRTVLRE